MVQIWTCKKLWKKDDEVNGSCHCIFGVFFSWFFSFKFHSEFFFLCFLFFLHSGCARLCCDNKQYPNLGCLKQQNFLYCPCYICMEVWFHVDLTCGYTLMEPLPSGMLPGTMVKWWKRNLVNHAVSIWWELYRSRRIWQKKILLPLIFIH